jgi:hypothetical protein
LIYIIIGMYNISESVTLFIDIFNFLIDGS